MMSYDWRVAGHAVSRLFGRMVWPPPSTTTTTTCWFSTKKNRPSRRNNNNDNENNITDRHHRSTPSPTAITARTIQTGGGTRNKWRCNGTCGRGSVEQTPHGRGEGTCRRNDDRAWPVSEHGGVRPRRLEHSSSLYGRRVFEYEDHRCPCRWFCQGPAPIDSFVMSDAGESASLRAYQELQSLFMGTLEQGSVSSLAPSCGLSRSLVVVMPIPLASNPASASSP
jgi:hypothetical protein